MQKFADQLSVPNVYSGYAYLVDAQNRVRWRGCGLARPADLMALRRATEALLDEAAPAVRR